MVKQSETNSHFANPTQHRVLGHIPNMVDIIFNRSCVSMKISCIILKTSTMAIIAVS